MRGSKLDALLFKFDNPVAKAQKSLPFFGKKEQVKVSDVNAPKPWILW